MIGKLLTVFSLLAAVAVAERCNYCGGYSSVEYGSGYRSINSNVYGKVYPFRLLNVARTVPVVPAYPTGSPVATPAVLSPNDPNIPIPVLSSGVVRSGIRGQRTLSGPFSLC